MKKIVLLSAFLYCSFQTIAQSPVDSLYSIWRDVSQHDTVRLNAMNELAYTAVGGPYGFVIGPDSLLVLANEMNALATNIGSVRYQVDANIHLARAYLFMRNLEEALLAATQALDAAERSGFQYGQLRAKALVAVYYNFSREPLEALDLYNEAYLVVIDLQSEHVETSIFGEINSYSLNKYVANLHNAMGEIYREMGSYLKALEHYELGLRGHLLDDNQLRVAALKNNIGIVYHNLEEYDKAMKYFEEALPVFEEFGHLVFQGNALGNMANIYLTQKTYNKAEEYMERNLKIQKGFGPYYEAKAYSSLAQLNLDKKNFTKAIEYIQRAEEIWIPMGAAANSDLARIKMYQGHIYMEQGNYQNSIELFQESSLLTDEINSLDLKANSVEYLYQVHKKSGKSDKALEYLEELLVLNDSLNKDETGKELLKVDLTNKFFVDSLAQAEDKKRAGLAYEKEILEETNTRNIFMASGLLLLIISGGLWNRLIFTRKSRKIIEKEKDRSENLLLNILPADVAEELKENGEAKARDFDMVTVIFTDFKGFTQTSEKLTANELVDELNYCFKGFDGIMGKFGIEKIKTIGDAYMAVGGLHGSADEAALMTTRAALEMQEFVMARKRDRDSQGLMAFEMRLGIHSGPVVAGIVGVKKFQYDIWGDTVNTASRMESSGEVGKVNISQATYELVEEKKGLSFAKRGKVEVKGKGELDMYFVSS
jgi:class 3 adenylate cyclase/lipopolysaccharide biosynthesis regulator YciM